MRWCDLRAALKSTCIPFYFRRVKSFLRIIVVLAILVAAGLLVWQWMTSAQQGAVKDRVKLLIGSNPRNISGTLPTAGAARLTKEGGLFTGDEAPFAFAAGPWSTVKFDLDGSTVRPNLRFDFEVPVSADTVRLSRKWSHGGERSYRMAPGDDYSPAVRRRVQDVATTLSAVEVGFWMWSPSPKTLVTAVVSIDRGSKQLAWFGKDLPADTGAAQGSRLNCSFLMRDLALEPTDIISVYFWKRGGEEAFVDDIDLYFHSAEVPGRAGGTAFALDSMGVGGLVPMGYATVSVTEVPVDTVRFPAGGTAVNTTEAVVPIGGTDKQWCFVPQEGVAYLIDADGTPIAMLRPWSPTSRTDITHFERVVAERKPHGVLLTGFDVDNGDGTDRIASYPAPQAMILELAPRR